VIVVVGRPGLDANDELDRPAGRIALAAAQAAAHVELVGSIGDDPAGDRVVLALGQAGVGHAALLRDPAAVTPRAAGPAGPVPRLDGNDVELGLAYLADYRVLVVAEPLGEGAIEAAAAAAAFQSAALVVLVAAGASAPAGLPDTATVLDMPAEGNGAFSLLLGHYAAALDAGSDAAAAWQVALAASGWQPSADEGTE
jgi:hypothetical protein